MFKTIVTALDGSACAEHAFAVALDSARCNAARLEICSIVDPVALCGHAPLTPPERERVAAAVAVAETLVAAATQRARAAGIDANARVIVGDPAPEILALAQTAAADAIVLGTHGTTGYRRLFMGGVAERVLRSSQCPVVVVRERALAERERAPLPSVSRETPVFAIRLVETGPERFEQLYGDIAEYMRGPGANLPGCVEHEIFGSEDGTRIVIVARFASHDAWSRAQWDAGFGRLLEELAIDGETLDFNLYRGDRFPAASAGNRRDDDEREQAFDLAGVAELRTGNGGGGGAGGGSEA